MSVRPPRIAPLVLLLVAPAFAQSAPKVAPLPYGPLELATVHAILDDKGKVLDAEVVQTSDPALAQAALGVVWHSSYRPAEEQNRPLQREAFINVKFTPPS